jgi:hypothetical protein
MIKVDLRYGLEKEDSLFSKIKGVYGENLCKTPHMCKWDFESGKQSYCVFSFTDGVYSIEITPDIIDKFELRQGGRWDRGRPELNQYYYIPIKLLSPISSDHP